MHVTPHMTVTTIDVLGNDPFKY